MAMESVSTRRRDDMRLCEKAPSLLTLQQVMTGGVDIVSVWLLLTAELVLRSGTLTLDSSPLNPIRKTKQSDTQNKSNKRKDDFIQLRKALLSMKEILYITSLLITNLAYQTTQSETEGMCRSRDNVTLHPEKFRIHSCIECYNYMRAFRFKENAKLNLTFFTVDSEEDFQTMLQNETVLNSFKNQDQADLWTQCCKEADQCCKTMLQEENKRGSGWCPRTWDGWMCWSDSPPGITQEQACPVYSASTMESCVQSNAMKLCDDSGNWGRHKSGNKEWTDYTPCSAKSMMERRVYFSLGSYATSVITLIPALFIFQKYRSLQCHRIILHKNLFASLLFHCSSEIAFNAAYLLDELSGTSTIKKNEVECRILLVVTKYFRLTNYMWMLCEGFYLHRQIVNVFAEETSLKMFYAIGWGFPILPIIVFVAFRKTLTDTDCWALPSEYIDWALHLPCLLSLLINAIFLINIVMVLITKLRAVHLDEPSQFRKAVRATLVLVPLFGLHFLLTIYRRRNICTVAEEYYVYLDYLFDGLQGSIVAIIFCYINSEVLTLLKRTWRNVRENHSLSQLHSTYNGTITTSVIQSQTVL